MFHCRHRQRRTRDAHRLKRIWPVMYGAAPRICGVVRAVVNPRVLGRSRSGTRVWQRASAADPSADGEGTMSNRNVLFISDFDPSSPFIGVSPGGSVWHAPDFIGLVGQDGEPRRCHDLQAGRQGRAPPVPRPRTTRDLYVAVCSASSTEALLWVFYHLVAIPDRGIFTVPKILHNVGDLGDWRPDVIVVSGPPFSAYLAGRRLARRWGVPWVADYRDLWTNSNYYICGPIRRRMDRVVERWILRTVALTITVSEPLAEDLRRDFGVRCEVVMNGYEADEFGPRRAEPTTGLPLRLVYTGEIHVGRSDPASFLEAIGGLV